MRGSPDVVRHVLATAATPQTTDSALAAVVLRFTVARLVVLVRNAAGVTALAVAPDKQRALLEHPSLLALLREAGELNTSRFYATDAIVPGLVSIQSAEKQTNCLVVPLICGDIRIGAVMVFGLVQGEALAAATSKLETLAPLLAMVLHNASLQHQSENKAHSLQASESRFQELLLRLPVPVALYDAQENVLLINDRMTAIYGYTKENVRDLAHYWPLAFPDPEARAEAQARWAAALVEAERIGNPATVPEDYLVTGLDGRVHITEAFGTRIGDGALVVFNDVTARRKADALLEENRAKLEQLVDERTREVRIRQERLVVALESTNTGLWSWDPTTRTMYFSPTYFTMLGWEPEEFPADQETWTSMVHPDDLPETFAFFHGIAVSPDDIAFSHEYRLRSKSGLWKWFLVRGKIVGRDDQKRVNRVVGVYIDITERKSGEQRLRMAMQALDTTRECVYWIDEDGRMLYVNPATEQELGYSSAELLQMSIPDIDPNTPPELWGPEGELTRRLEVEGMRKFLTQHRHKDGHLIPVEVDSDAFHFNGQTCFIAIARDISERLAAEEALRKSEAKFLAIFSMTPEPMALTRLKDGMVIEASRSYADFFGFRREELIGRTTLPGDLGLWVDAEHRRQWKKIIERDGEVIGFETPLRRKDGATGTVLISGKILEMDGEKCVIVDLHDISERRTAEEALRKSEAKFSALFNMSPDPLALTRLKDGKIIEISRSFAEKFGYQADDAIGRSTQAGDIGLWVDNDQRIQWAEQIARDGEAIGVEAQLRRKDGSIITALVSGKIVDMAGEQCVLANAHDVTEQRQHAEYLERIAHHDPLTGLPNRLLLGDRLRQAIARNQRGDDLIAVCYLDLDGFKEINDRFGHEAGDELLIEVADRLKACVRGGDTVARLGGDEFVVLLAGLANEEEYRIALKRLLQTVSAPYTVDNGEQAGVTASIGVTLFPNDQVDPDTLVRHADHAMYAAKQAGKNRYQLFDTQLEQRIEARMATLQLLTEAQESGQFRLYYQPKVDCRQGVIVGAEALIRWQHPTLGLLSPAEFLPLIEDTDLALSIGDWVFREALSQMAEWRREGIDLCVSVNVFVRHLLHPGFADALAEMMKQYPEVGPGCLRIEIVETAALKALDTIRQVIEDCQKHGVEFSLDDFGTGYSTLAYLRHLPATEIKIDHSFVRYMLERPEDLAIVEAVIAMGHAFGRSIVAEGAETPAHIIRLRALGCDVIQGYALARPMAGTDIPRWVREFRPDPSWYKPDNHDV